MSFQKTATKTLALLLIVLFNVWTPTTGAALNDHYAMVFFFAAIALTVISLPPSSNSLRKAKDCKRTLSHSMGKP